ncbi:hypothetical protein [Labilibaculum sp.]|uniref:hypothetical protein n=1 Tax=Labilibaculum sp. TaxID=2060723 RepID=UPI002AA7E8A9|nr:hypothetical protein [Labilibaculum sp.]
MTELVKLYWKVYRLKIAIVITLIIIGATLLLPLLKVETFDLVESLIQSVIAIGLYIIMTPVFVIGYYFYKKQQQDRNPGYKMELPDIYSLDIYLSVYTVYATLAFIASLFMDNIFH